MVKLESWFTRLEVVSSCILLLTISTVTTGFTTTFSSPLMNVRRTAQCRLLAAQELRASSALDSFGSASFLTTEVVSSPSPTDFAPVLPDTSALIGFGSVLLLCGVAAYVWATQVVPVSRTKLARSKQSGPVREYLDDLADEDSSDERSLERWLFTDWLEGPKRQKQSALPVLKKAKWNSGDNPVLAATALILLGVIFTSITERVATMM